MSESTSESSGSATGLASESPPVTEANILVGASSTDVLPAGVEAGVAFLPEPTDEGFVSVASDGGKLELVDVLASNATDPNLGAFLTIDTVGGNTVISVETSGTGVGTPVQFVTLEGVTGMTLQDLLASNLITG